ncbi:anthranilate synthase component I, partial [Staphylococcus epidermidis]|nr:anthranilate synthase component I [Staphylococcus epidermidis]
MDIVYKKVNAQITPEALAKLKQKKIIFESTNQQKLKGRYSIVVFDHYGKITLDNSQLLIKLDNHCEIVKNQPYQRLKEFVDKYYFEIKDKYLKDLPFI